MRSIVVGTDGSETATRAVRHAASMARAAGAELHVVTAYEPRSSVKQLAELDRWPAELRWMGTPGAMADAVLRQAASVAAKEGVTIEGHARLGDPAKTLVAVAAEVDADVIVVGNKGMYGPHRLLGSVPNTVSHTAGRDVLIVNTTLPAA